jgi:hypothetical protein
VLRCAAADGRGWRCQPRALGLALGFNESLGLLRNVLEGWRLRPEGAAAGEGALRTKTAAVKAAQSLRVPPFAACCFGTTAAGLESLQTFQVTF